MIEHDCEILQHKVNIKWFHVDPSDEDPELEMELITQGVARATELIMLDFSEGQLVFEGESRQILGYWKIVKS